MEFKPQHTQPFTFEQALLLDVPVITTEIARLQNSLARLRDTQEQLRENVESEGQPDPEILQALEENNHVISSQTERIVLLRHALGCKGLVNPTNLHYDDPLLDSPKDAKVLEPTGTTEEANHPNGIFL